MPRPSSSSSVLLTLALALLIASASAQSFPPNVTMIIAGYGYPVEEHRALTPDGWSLLLIRIPRGHAGQSNGKVVFFQHGLTDSAAGCTLNDPEMSFPYLLADQGYDVWLGNNRGNGLSMTNAQYTPEDAGFWNFTWDDFALTDLPTQINYVLSYTGVQKLSYIGHSQGTIQAFAGFIRNHTLAAQVSLYIALAPVAYVAHITTPVLKAMALLDTDKIFELLGIKEWYPPDVIDKILPDYCKLFPSACQFDVDLVCGPTTFLNDSRLPYYLHYEPNPTSVKNMAQWAQNVRDGTFSMFDYGAAGNMLMYNQTTPPPYDIAKFPMTLPLAIFNGGEDYLADPADVATLLSQLPIVPMVHTEPQYAHLDPLLGENAYQRIYPLMIDLLAQYNV